MKPDALNTNDLGPVRMGRISFINVDPVYYGIEHENLSSEVRIVSAPPAELNRKLAAGLLDISSVSSAAYGIHSRDWLLLPGLSIACSGNVMSVLLVGRYPLSELHGKRVYVSDESATAKALMMLMFSYKNISPQFETRKIHTPSQVDPEAAAALVIGDASMRHDWHGEFDYVWDLGDLWARHSKLPFVFAVWAVRKEFAEKHPARVSRMVNLLMASKRIGLANIETVVQSSALKLGIDPYIVQEYFKNFCFDLNKPEETGLKMFFNDLYEKGIINDPVHIRHFTV